MEIPGLKLHRTAALVFSLIPASLYAAPLILDSDNTVDFRGPIHNIGMRVTVKPGEVQAPDYRFKNECTKPDAWAAKWIWIQGDEKSTAGLFRKTIHLAAVPKRARVWISADVCYRLYINGKLVARGPADMGRDYDREERAPRWMYDYRDISGSLKAGDNVLSAEVFTQGFVSSRVSRGKHALLLEAKLSNADGTSVTVKTDESWRGIADKAWSGGGEYDASRELNDWRMPAYDDASWSPCKTVESVWTPLVASEIPPLMEARYPIQSALLNHQTVAVNNGVVAPITITGPGVVDLKYDRVLAAYPTFKLIGVQGATLRVVPGERVGDSSRTCTLKLRDGEQLYEYPFIDSFSALHLEFKNIPAGKTIQLIDAGANFSSMPVTYAGSFECSAAVWNDLWKNSRWLTQICMQTHHLDSPNHQEPICDPGDYLIESHANYYAFGNPWLARQDLRKFGLLLKDLNYRNFHTSYSLLWLQMLLNYYDYTGDQALVRELSPEAHALLDTFTSWIGKNGLISEAPNYMFMDWVSIAGFECHHPPAVIGQGYMTAFYYRGLSDGIRIATLMHDADRVKKYTQLRKQINDAFQRELWVPSKGLYRDGKPFQTSVPPSQWLPADKDIETFSPHVNTLAVLYDLAPKARRADIMDRVFVTQPINCEPYFTYFVLEALSHCHDVGFGDSFEKYAHDLFRQWKTLPDTQTYHEMWNSGDLSHAWGSAPMIQMSSTILGVRPISPGFDRVSIDPEGFGQFFVKGIVPTRHGPIAVNYSFDGDTVNIEVSVPPGVTAEVMVPTKTGTKKVIWTHGKHSIHSSV